VKSVNKPELAHLSNSNAPRDSAREFSILGLWAGVRKNWWLTTAVTVVVIVAVAFYTLSQTKLYRAQATILFDPQPPRPLGNEVQQVVDVGQSSYWNNKEYYRTQFWILKSRALASTVVRELGLHRDAGFIRGKPANEVKGNLEVTVEQAADILISRLEVEAIRESRLAEIRYRDADPKRAQRILARVCDNYVEQNLEQVLESTNTAADWLRGQLSTLKSDLESSELALHEYKKTKNVLSVSIDDQSNMLRAEMTRLNDVLTDLRARREHANARRNELMKIDAKDPAELPAQELINNHVLQGLRASYIEGKRNLEAALARGKGEEHPDTRALRSSLEETRRAILLEVNNIQRSVDSDWEGLNREIAGLSALSEEAKQRALQLNLLEIEYKRLQRDRDTNERLFGIVTERTKESDLTRMLRINNIRVVDRPRQPSGPVSPVLPLNLGIGALAGLVLGVALAIGREQLDRSIKTPEDLEVEHGLLFLGLLPAVGTPAAIKKPKQLSSTEQEWPELIVHYQPTSGTAEAARALRTNILYMSPDRPYRTLLVTSAGPAEGKTTVACCVAVAMAHAGHRVVLLDCDMRRPRVHRVFGLSNEAGVTTAMIDPSTTDSIIHDTVVPNMKVICTGPIPPNPSELLHSEAFARLLENLTTRFDRIIIDSPPVVPVTDAAILATQVDGTMLIVRAFQTSRELVRRAKRTLTDVGAHMVGAVLNAVELERPEYGYYRYHYYKRDGTYSARSDRDSEPHASSSGDGALRH
jgi:capsular exopolysaccharide synthesis family protein